MAKLTAKARNALPKKDFALHGDEYPIEDASHARNALSRVSAYGSQKEKATVRRKVHAKYPGIGESHGGEVEGHKAKHRPDRKHKGK